MWGAQSGSLALVPWGGKIVQHSPVTWHPSLFTVPTSHPEQTPGNRESVLPAYVDKLHPPSHLSPGPPVTCSPRTDPTSLGEDIALPLALPLTNHGAQTGLSHHSDPWYLYL